MHKAKVGPGIFWVEEPELDLRVLCGCPADTVKHLIAKGFITTVERGGATFETGPNAILLSDVPVQQGEFCNLSEFPVLQMFYRQGMIIPGHPNNTGTKPLLIGSDDQLRAQMGYIYRGTYGLESLEEILAAGVEPETAEEMMRIKLEFAFGRIHRPEELLDVLPLAGREVAIRGGMTVERRSLNNFVFRYKDEEVDVNLDLGPEERFQPPFALGQHKVKREYFSVIHTGEGDGWDPSRPCMASIVVFQGRIYLVDAGPNLNTALEALGLTVNEVEGVFHSHCHDDHFAGLPSLLRADHRVKYFATPLVRASVAKKLAALLDISEEGFADYFEIHDLSFDTWNQVEGLEVMPVYSPHPVEANILFFRTRRRGGYTTYAHLADVASFDVLERVVLRGKKPTKASKALYSRIKDAYLSAADLKKIDVGGGMIHGSALNYAGDGSGKLVFSHIARGLSLREKEIGSDTSFGMRDVLLRDQNPVRDAEVEDYIRLNFPGVPDHDVAMLANETVRTLNLGTMLMRRNSSLDMVYLITNGLVEIIDAEMGLRNRLSAGSIAGEYAALLERPLGVTYRAASFVRVLEIPVDLFVDVLSRHGLVEQRRSVAELCLFLEGTPLLGDFISSGTRRQVAGGLRATRVAAGKKVNRSGAGVFLVRSGRVSLRFDGTDVDSIGPGGFFGEDSIQHPERTDRVSYVAGEDSELAWVPHELIDGIPIISWKLLESCERRSRRAELEAGGRSRGPRAAG